MTYEDLMQVISSDQKIINSVTCLQKPYRGSVHISQIMTGYEAKLERHLYSACVTGIEVTDNILKIYAREYISFSDL